MTVKRTTVLGGVLALVVFLGSATGALGAKPAATFTEIDFPGAVETSPREINEVGEIVGFYQDSFGESRGFLLSQGTFTTIDVPGELNTRVYGINPSGDIVGSFGDSEDVRQSFLLSQGVFSTFGFPGAPRTEALTISADGVIVGFYVSATGPVFVHGFSLSGTGFTSIDVTPSDVSGANYTLATSIAGGGRRAGWYRVAGEGFREHGFFLSPKKGITLIDVDDATQTNVRELSPNGTVIGDSNSNGVLENAPFEDRIAFIWRRGKFTTSFSYPGAFSTIASGINAQGQIVGTYREYSGGDRRGYLRNP